MLGCLCWGAGGAPGAGMDRGSRDSAAPSVRSSSIFRRGIMRASRPPPPWTGLFASPSRRASRAVLCWAMPGSFDPVTSADAGSWRGLGRVRNRKVQRAGSWGRRGEPAGPGGCSVVRIRDPSHSLRRILLWNAVARVTHRSAPQGFGCGLGTPQRRSVPRGWGQDAFTSCSQPSQQWRGGKLGAMAWNGPAGVSPGFITLPVAAGQR